MLDLSAAFDLVDPGLLLEKLKIYGVEEEILVWLESYLTGRHQAVWIDHVMSDFLPCEVGVPQGSNLGPLLFLIFFNDLPQFLSCDVDAYADDTTMSVAGATPEENIAAPPNNDWRMKMLRKLLETRRQKAAQLEETKTLTMMINSLCNT